MNPLRNQPASLVSLILIGMKTGYMQPRYRANIGHSQCSKKEGKTHTKRDSSLWCQALQIGKKDPVKIGKIVSGLTRQEIPVRNGGLHNFS